MILETTDIHFYAGQAERGLLLAGTQGGPHRRAGNNHRAEGMACISSLACLIAKTRSFSLVSFDFANRKKDDTNEESRVNDKLQLQLSQYRLNQLHLTERSIYK